MSANENIPQDQEIEEESPTDGTTSADPSDTVAAEGDPPIIIQGGGSGTT
jgi:hypothetical protein